MVRSLNIDVQILTDPIRRSAPCIVAVTIVNRGKDTVLVNKRLAVGYRTSEFRELFFEIFRKDSNERTAAETVFYHRAQAGPEDYSPLAPGDSISTRLNLFQWYEVVTVASYDLQAFYQADEPFAAPPDGILDGIHQSIRVPFTVTE